MTAIERACDYFQACQRGREEVKGCRTPLSAWRRLQPDEQSYVLRLGGSVPRSILARIPRCGCENSSCPYRWLALPGSARRAIERSPEFKAWLEKTWKRATQEPRKAAR